MAEPVRVRYRCISGDPVILAGPFDHPHNNFFNPQIVAALGDRQAFMIVYQSATLERPERAARVIEVLRERMAAHPRHRYFAMCNTAAEVEILSEAGIPCGLINSNAMINEAFFRPKTNVARTHDAVSNAGLVPMKRIELARLVPSLALLFVDYHRSGPQDDAYVESLRAAMPQALFVNRPQPQDSYRWVEAAEVVDWHNRCHVGLCLSAAEGAMRASMEYLLCGLPVVSTQSQGGRDVFFHPSFVRIVEPDPVKVADAVAALISERIPPARIRGYVVPQLRAMRHRFQWLIQNIFDETGAGRVFAPDWNAFLGANWLRFGTADALLADLDSLRAQGC